MTHLHMQGAIAETIACLDTFCTADTEGFIDRIFIIGIFNKGSFDCPHGTYLVFGTFVDRIGLRFEKAEAYRAIAADIKGVDTLYGRFFQHACRFALSAGTAFVGVYLPDMRITAPPVQPQSDDTAYGHEGCSPQRIPQEFTATFLVVFLFASQNLLLCPSLFKFKRTQHIPGPVQDINMPEVVRRDIKPIPLDPFLFYTDLRKYVRKLFRFRHKPLKFSEGIINLDPGNPFLTGDDAAIRKDTETDRVTAGSEVFEPVTEPAPGKFTISFYGICFYLVSSGVCNPQQSVRRNCQIKIWAGYYKPGNVLFRVLVSNAPDKIPLQIIAPDNSLTGISDKNILTINGKACDPCLITQAGPGGLNLPSFVGNDNPVPGSDIKVFFSGYQTKGRNCQIYGLFDSAPGIPLSLCTHRPPHSVGPGLLQK